MRKSFSANDFDPRRQRTAVLRISRVEMAPGEKSHVRNLRALPLQYRLARNPAPVNELDVPPSLSPPGLPVFRP